MQIRNINNNSNFTGVYQLNANQPMPDQNSAVRRDMALGYWTQLANNGNTIYDELESFFNGEYNSNPDKELNIQLDLPDNKNKDFEEMMNVIG